MGKILIVDDNPLSRRLLSVSLEADGHSLVEAGDGAEGLRCAREERPDLIISDIVMPSMDGCEFVRALRADPLLRATPVLFHTAHYHEREARSLALSLGVPKVLVKPCPPGDLVAAVEQALSGASQKTSAAHRADAEHSRLAAIRLSERVDALLAANARFEALTELNVELASETDPPALLERACSGARNLLGARYAVLALSCDQGSRAAFFCTSGIDFGGKPPTPPANAGPLTTVVLKRRAWRAGDAGGGLTRPLFPNDYPPAQTYLAVPLSAAKRAYGWLCLADKIGADTFNDDDERMLISLGAIAGRMYESAGQIAALQMRADQREKA